VSRCAVCPPAKLIPKEPMHQTADPCNIIIANVRAANPDLSGTELRVKLREAHAEYVRWILDTSK